MGVTRIPPDIRNTGVGQTPGTAAVSGISSIVVPSNSSRVSLYLSNIGTSDIWISCDVTAVLNKGILLGRNGGSVLLDATAFTNGPIHAITSGGSSNVTFQELNN